MFTITVFSEVRIGPNKICLNKRLCRYFIVLCLHIIFIFKEGKHELIMTLFKIPKSFGSTVYRKRPSYYAHIIL